MYICFFFILECQPCPPQTEKKERGCYPCQHVYMRNTDDQDTSKPPQQQFQLGSHVSEVNKTRDVTHELDATSTLIYDRVIKEEPVEVESIICIPRNAAIIVGSLAILVIVVAVFIVFKCRRHHRQPKTSDYNDDSQKEKSHKVTIIQKNSLLFNMEHSETNVSKTPKAACNGSDDTSHKRKPLDLKGKTVATRLIPEAQDSGYSTTQSTVAPTAVLISKDTVYSSENNCNNSPAGTSLCLRNGTSSPTEHDEESTQLKYCP
ncbi:uncharacterized protein LOC132551215 [Ylistrum balloti]|uniref:uncharacterized protein LOC132551215 n=1 Tax=Ylistrum balloti TaxID=509963 RepID=UPI002905BFD9|nr:uncharacterized protein LOC132551215 [Ylistrum balloti]